MSLRVIHHAGNKDLLLKKIKLMANHLTNDLLECYTFSKDELKKTINAIVNGDFSSPYAVIILSHAISNYFEPVSSDYKIRAYLDFSHRGSEEKLATTLKMFVDGRNFSTGNAGVEDDEITCGYLTPEEVKEFLEILKKSAPNITDEEDKELIDDLIECFSILVKENSGDLFVMR